MCAMADHGRPPKHTPSEDPCYLWARSLDPYVCFVGAFLWQAVIVITRRMVGALGTIGGSRVLDSDDDEGSGTSRFVYDVRSYGSSTPNRGAVKLSSKRGARHTSRGNVST